MNLHSLHFRPFTALKTTLAALCLTGLALGTAPAAIMIDTVAVGNAGNPAAGAFSGLGAVSYDYNIGKYEVTLTQYTGFLNAVAATDTFGLYNTSMGTNLNIAGITRMGISGSHTYAVAGDGNRPVTYVSFYDAMRFANWVGNGQPIGAQTAGTTEAGAYTMSLGGLAPRNAGATVFVTSENEWYKAAYYDPTKGGSNYWRYPTRSDGDPGNAIGALGNQANYIAAGVGHSVTQSFSTSSTQNYLTAGGAYSGSASYYGTFDQGGIAAEWNETVISFDREVRGGSWNDFVTALKSNSLDSKNTVFTSPYIGFRLASIGPIPEPVPEPGTALFGLACVGVAALRRRRRQDL